MAKKYSVKRKEMDVDIELEDNTIKQCVIKEMMGNALDEWTQLGQGRAVMDKDGTQSLKPVPKLHARLISMCLHDRNDGKLIPMEVIESWNSSTQRGLYDDCVEVCGLIERIAESEKKS